MKNKKRVSIFVAIFVCVLSITGVMAENGTTESVTLNKSSYQASSDNTKYGMAANYYANNYSDSEHSIIVDCMAGWKGPWPYTSEANMILGIGKTGTKTVTQSKTSRFNIYLHGGYAHAHTYGKVTVTR